MEVYVKRTQEVGLTAPNEAGLQAGRFVGRVSTRASPVTREAIMSEIIEGNEQILREPTLITAEPLFLRNHGHENCEIMLTVLNQIADQEETDDYKRIVGYYVTACKCGYCLTMELHSVLFHVPTETFMDLTTDMFGELTKWFVPLNLDGLSFEGQKAFVARIGEARYEYLYTWDGPHKCDAFDDVVWEPHPQYPCGQERVRLALSEIDCWMYENDVVPVNSDTEEY